MKKILIALDYDSLAGYIAQEGYSIGKAMNAAITLLHVVADPLYYSSLKYAPVMGAFDAFITPAIEGADIEPGALQSAAINFLEEIKAKLGDASIQIATEKGDAGEAILKAAKDMAATIIVMGSHGRSGLNKILAGSVAEEVLHHSNIPLLIIPIKK
jgi:nucleotide-binding universal stress UspA family protein